MKRTTFALALLFGTGLAAAAGIPERLDAPNYKRLSPSLAVSGKPSKEALASLREAGFRTAVDLRQPAQLARSVLFHRLALLGVHWAVPTATGRTTGTFKEAWQLEWRPELAVDLIEAGLHGTTVESAATAKAIAEATASEDLAAITALGKEHRVVTQGTSLIVLDRVEDYVRHQIVPPEEDLRKEYDTRLAQEGKQPRNRDAEEAHMKQVVAMWAEFKDIRIQEIK